MSAVGLRHILLLLPLFFGPSLVGSAALHAQQTETEQELERRLGRDVSPQEIMRGLAGSGLTRQQVRARLQQRGLDPSLADPYFDRMEGRSEEVLPRPGGDFVGALTEMGLIGPSAGPDRPSRDTLTTDTIGSRPDSIAPGDSIPIFGKGIFSRRTDQFAPAVTGPVPADYRLGPGDEVSLLLTGDVELGYTLPVSREGFVVIPDVGRVFVNGLTVAELEERLYDRLGRVYSGVHRGPDATTRFDLSMGRLRSNQVFVVGEAEEPGAYVVSSVGTVLDALYRAGGPSLQGSFRAIEVRRGRQLVGVIDLYEYLLTGETDGDLRLNQGDVIFIPLAGSRVRATGAVRREAIYELLPTEGLEHVIAFAGGPTADADVRRVRIDRILPFRQRVSGRERVLEVVDLLSLTDAQESLPLSDGDWVRVPEIGEEQKNRVTLVGFVQSPGEFELMRDMTVWDLVERAGGLRPEAFQPVAHVRRLEPADSTYQLLRVSLERTPDGGVVDDLQLADQDSVTVFGRPTLVTSAPVTIAGEVKEPGRYPFSRGMTAEDLILAADGFTEEAHGLEIEVSRLRLSAERNDTIAERFRLGIRGDVPWSTGDRLAVRGEAAAGLPDAGEFTLLQGDQVFVRRLPGFVEPGAVALHGEVGFPGSYAFNVREERLSSFVRRAGGLTADAYPDGARVERDSIPLGIDLKEALRTPGGGSDPVLRPGDRLIVPVYDGTVAVRGAVAFESRVAYRPGAGLDYYLSQAGGVLEEGDEGRINVEHQNGERGVTKKTLWVKRYPEVRPGSVVNVPVAGPDAGTDWSNIITTSLSILSTTATLILAIGRL